MSNWTKDAPKHPGWYWTRTPRHGVTVARVSIVPEGQYNAGDLCYCTFGSHERWSLEPRPQTEWWSTPMETPGAALRAREVAG